MADRVVICSSVPEERVRTIAMLLVREGHAPNWFADIPSVRSTDEFKRVGAILHAPAENR